MKGLGDIILQLFIILFFSIVVVYSIVNYSTFAPLLWFIFWLVLGYTMKKIISKDSTRINSKNAYMAGYTLLGIGVAFYFLKGGTLKSNTFPFVLAIFLMYVVSPLSIKLVGLENINYISDLKDLLKLILASLISLAFGVVVSLLAIHIIR